MYIKIMKNLKIEHFHHCLGTYTCQFNVFNLYVLNNLGIVQYLKIKVLS